MLDSSVSSHQDIVQVCWAGMMPLCPFSFSRGWGLCLDDPPAREVLDYPLVPPGVLYDVGHQCRLQYGTYSTFCEDMDVSQASPMCTGLRGSLGMGGLCVGQSSPSRLNLCLWVGRGSNCVSCFPQSVCHTLWCTVGNTCHSKLDAAVDGTACGDSKVRGSSPPTAAETPCPAHRTVPLLLAHRDGLSLLPGEHSLQGS